MKKGKKKNVTTRKKSKLREISDYDDTDTTSFLDLTKRVTFEDLGIQLPKQPPTQVVSIRLPTELLNEIRAFGSERDIPYQALIKLFLSEAMAEKGRMYKKKKAA